MSDMGTLITKLETLVEGRNTSVPYANDIEGNLVKLFTDHDDDVIEDFIYDLAFYRPEGGEGLYNFRQFQNTAAAGIQPDTI